MSQDIDLRTDTTPEGPDGTSGVVPSDGESAARRAKVELDLDDAPFLEEPKEEKTQEKITEPEKPAPASPRPKAAETVPLKGVLTKLQALLADKKKRVILGGGLVFVIFFLPLLLLFTLGEKEKPPKLAAREPERIVISGVPEREEAPAGPKFLYRLGGFFIEYRGSEGELRFVHASFAIPTDNPALFAELRVKEVVIRDAIFYYLRNKPLTALAEPASRDLLKADLITVLNEHLSSEKVQELFFEEYLVTGG